MTENYLQVLIEEINKHYTCYYEEVPKNATFPYLVIPHITLTPLDAGYICLTDIYIYNNELSNISVETICDTLRENFDNFSKFDAEKGIGFHLGFENQNLGGSNEQDLIERRISFSSRIFKIS